jgi:ATP-dependent Clp protease ATP-binding subunit ClpA
MVSGLGSVVLAGPSGSGLTACAVEVLARHTLTERAGPTDSLAGIEPQHRYVVRVDCALIATEMLYPASSDERVRRLMADCLAEPDVYYLFDNVQWALGAGPLAQAAVVAAIERGLRCVATLQTDVFRSTRMLGTLARRTHWIELSALERAELLEILSCRARTIAAGCGIRVEPQAITSCLELSSRGAGAEPGRCLSLLEGAAALVLGSSAGRIGPDEVAAAARALVPIEH